MSEGKTPPPRSGADRLDAALAAWPTAERTALEWDDSAERVLSLATSGESTKLGKTLSRVSDEDLLRPPLPTSPGEVQSSAPTETRIEGTGMTTASRERDRAGFRDLARLANMTPPPSGPVSSASTSSGDRSSSGAQAKDFETNSGVIDLAAISAGEEAKAGPASASVAPTAPGMATMRSAVSEPKPAAAVAAIRAEKKKGPPWMAISTVVAAAAVAAGVFFGLQHGNTALPPAAVADATPPAPTSTPVAAAQTAAAPVANPTPPPPEDRGVDPSSLPPASTGAVALRPGSIPPAAGKPGAAPTPTTDPALVAVVPTATASAAPGASANLQNLMQQAAGVTSGPTATATATASPDPGLPAPGSVPLKPSQGAIQGALGAALPSARGCLGPDDPISHATVTFKSDGSVQSVSVSGGAAGKPAEACIRAALSKARVTPFAQPTFTAPATVRPN